MRTVVCPTRLVRGPKTPGISASGGDVVRQGIATGQCADAHPDLQPAFYITGMVRAVMLYGPKAVEPKVLSDPYFFAAAAGDRQIGLMKKTLIIVGVVIAPPRGAGGAVMLHRSGKGQAADRAAPGGRLPARHARRLTQKLRQHQAGRFQSDVPTSAGQRHRPEAAIHHPAIT